MKKVTQSIAVSGIVAGVMLWVVNAYAAPPFLGPQGPPVWCYGLNSLERCVLFLGTEESCKNVDPCNILSAAGGGDPVTFGAYFCLGEDELGVCQLFAATDPDDCDDLIPCRANIGQLPRLPKVKTER